MNLSHSTSVAVVGGGFGGLSVAYELARAGVPVTVLEADREIGGLAAPFTVGGEQVERFYHHWFTSDRHALDLVEEVGLGGALALNPTRTGIYYANGFFRLSTPADLLRFTPLPFVDRIRLGLLAIRARRVEHWRELEDKTAHEWLRELGGERAYRIVWQPLMRGKFGPYAERISAVWFWNKLKLRGSSRGKAGEERLAYLKGGFGRLADAMAARIRAQGGRIELGAPVEAILPDDDEGWRVVTRAGEVAARRVVATPALPLVADLVQDWAGPAYLQRLRRIEYLANVCLVLELDRPLSSTYWLNVNDPDFPFVGVIEHTNFESPDSYGGRHVVYLSKYLPHTEPLYRMDADEVLDFAWPHLRRMFPALRREWVLGRHVWKARWAQPVVECRYGSLVPPEDGPREGFHLCSMAQIYPEDRGTNYAIREGRRLGRRLVGLEQRAGVATA